MQLQSTQSPLLRGDENQPLQNAMETPLCNTFFGMQRRSIEPSSPSDAQAGVSNHPPSAPSFVLSELQQPIYLNNINSSTPCPRIESRLGDTATWSLVIHVEVQVMPHQHQAR
ncbi:hypothetical protein TcWFU_010480 [Taenia crassiceps]|uniref:Uncharacterized protein n=1 Tax=Taenia crassiceps TaxID=6207 RepID=A0ABR4QBS8_9CEST